MVTQIWENQLFSCPH